MIYNIEDTEALLKEMLEDKDNAYDLIYNFYLFLNKKVYADEDKFVVEALPSKKYIPETDSFSEKKMLLSLTREFKRDHEDELWQAKLSIYFTMDPYFNKYESKPGNFAYQMFKLFFNFSKNCIWATNKYKELQIKLLIMDIVRHGKFESFVTELEYTDD